MKVTSNGKREKEPFLKEEDSFPSFSSSGIESKFWEEKDVFRGLEKHHISRLAKIGKRRIRSVAKIGFRTGRDLKKFCTFPKKMICENVLNCLQK